jgi:hypothetical protein
VYPIDDAVQPPPHLAPHQEQVACHIRAAIALLLTWPASAVPLVLLFLPAMLVYILRQQYVYVHPVHLVVRPWQSRVANAFVSLLFGTLNPIEDDNTSTALPKHNIIQGMQQQSCFS